MLTISVCICQEEIGLAIGERRLPGYSFSGCPPRYWKEPAGRKGFHAGLYSVLVEADDMNRPGPMLWGILDGHGALQGPAAKTFSRC